MKEKGVGATHCKQNNNQRGIWQCITNKKKPIPLTLIKKNQNLGKKQRPWWGKVYTSL
jgi:hypothetical protein